MNLFSDPFLQWSAAIIFALALLHTFSVTWFERLAKLHPKHAGIWHLLGEVEVVFGFWALILVVIIFLHQGEQAAIGYLESRNFTEPLFVFAIMVIAGTRPILQIATSGVQMATRLLPLSGSLSLYIMVLTIVPMLGSFITEPAAMTLAAMILAKEFFARNISHSLKYATLGVLLVNVSIGGVLTSYAAPPVLMVASKWNWDSFFMLSTFGWKAALAVTVNACGAALLFHQELSRLPAQDKNLTTGPWLLTLLHVTFLAGVVVFAHHPVIFLGLFLFFLGVAQAYQAHQNRLILREGLLVAFFLAGLVVLGGIQQWWLKPLLLGMSNDAVFLGATALTAITDNAALTYLGSLVDGTSGEFKYALMAGAVTGGGLTIIANAPNPAGIAILRNYFGDQAVHPGKLFLAAIAPTLVAAAAFWFL